MDFPYLAAIDVAREAHKDQKRKYTGEPYIVHPFAVAGLVASVTHNNDMIVAAMLHDVVEDSNVTLETIKRVFGTNIAYLVKCLTNVSVPSNGNRSQRKHLDRKNIALASKDAKTIKLADIIDNTKNIAACDPEFAKIYMYEKRLLLGVLVEGNRDLFDLAVKIVSEYYSNEENN